MFQFLSKNDLYDTNTTTPVFCLSYLYSNTHRTSDVNPDVYYKSGSYVYTSG